MIYHPNTLAQLCYLKANLDWSKQGPDANLCFLFKMLMGAKALDFHECINLSSTHSVWVAFNYVEKYIREKELECQPCIEMYAKVSRKNLKTLDLKKLISCWMK